MANTNPHHCRAANGRSGTLQSETPSSWCDLRVHVDVTRQLRGYHEFTKAQSFQCQTGIGMGGRLFAVGVGVSEYDAVELAELAFPHTDAARVCASLVQAAQHPKHVSLLPSTAGAADVLAAFQALLGPAGARAGDRVLFYFAGHGLRVSRPVPDHLLLLKRADIALLNQGMAVGNDVLSVRTLLAYLKRWPVDSLLVLDTCSQSLEGDGARPVRLSPEEVLAGLGHRGDFLMQRQGAKATPELAADPRQTVLATGGQEGRAHELASLDGGLFARAFVPWLRGAMARGETAFVDSGSLSAWAATMQQDARAAGLQLNQTPWLSQTTAGFMVYAPAPRLPGQQPQAQRAVLAVPEPWHPDLVLVDVQPKTGVRYRLAVSRDPVTVAQWSALMAPAAAVPPADAKRAMQPMTGVDLRGMEHYTQRLNERIAAKLGPMPAFRLLQADEWVALCHGGTTGQRCGGGRRCAVPTPKSAVFRWSEQGYRQAHNPRTPLPVDDPRNICNTRGLRGLRGNVRELVMDTGKNRGARLIGGGFKSAPADLSCGHTVPAPCQVADLDDVGFRVARLATSAEQQLPLQEPSP